MQRHTQWLKRFFVLTTLMLAIGPVARAADITWTNAAGGSFHEPLNWLPNQVPGTNDMAVFSLTNAPYTVTWSESVTNFQFFVEAGTVTWDLQGHTYFLNLERVNTIGTTATTAHFAITNGIVKPVTAAARYSNPLRVQGSGTILHLRNAQLLRNNYPIIENDTLVLVDGPNAVFDGLGYSRKVSGTVIVTNGAYLVATDGFHMTDGGYLHISGPEPTSSSYRGNLAMGSLHANAAVRYDNDVVIRGDWRTDMDFYGTLTLENARYFFYYLFVSTIGRLHLHGEAGVIQGNGRLEFNTIFNRGGTFRPGGLNRAGRLTIAGMLTNAVPETGVIEIELGGATEAEYDRLELVTVAGQTWATGTLYAGGALTVSFIEAYQPLVPTTFKIIDAVSIVGAFDSINLPDLSGEWLTANLYSSGEITYIPPPPGSILLVR
jgi:hypothetical protein